MLIFQSGIKRDIVVQKFQKTVTIFPTLFYILIKIFFILNTKKDTEKFGYNIDRKIKQNTMNFIYCT